MHIWYSVCPTTLYLLPFPYSSLNLLLPLQYKFIEASNCRILFIFTSSSTISIISSVISSFPLLSIFTPDPFCLFNLHVSAYLSPFLPFLPFLHLFRLLFFSPCSLFEYFLWSLLSNW